MTQIRGYLRAAAKEEYTDHLQCAGFNSAATQQMRSKLKVVMNRTALKAEQFQKCEEVS